MTLHYLESSHCMWFGTNILFESSNQSNFRGNASTTQAGGTKDITKPNIHYYQNGYLSSHVILDVVNYFDPLTKIPFSVFSKR